LIAILLALVGLGLFSGGSLSAQAPNANQQSSGPTLGASYKNDISPPVRNMPPWKASDLKAQHEANENPKVPYRHHDTPDPVIQKSHVSALDLLAPNLPAPSATSTAFRFLAWAATARSRHEWSRRPNPIRSNSERGLSGF
jgi:hypothetical protein